MASLADRNKKRDIENYSKGIDLFVSPAESGEDAEKWKDKHNQRDTDRKK